MGTPDLELIEIRFILTICILITNLFYSEFIFHGSHVLLKLIKCTLNIMTHNNKQITKIVIFQYRATSYVENIEFLLY